MYPTILPAPFPRITPDQERRYIRAIENAEPRAAQNYQKPDESRCRWPQRVAVSHALYATNLCYDMKWARAFQEFRYLQEQGCDWIPEIDGRYALSCFFRTYTTEQMKNIFDRATKCIAQAPAEVTSYLAFAVAMFELDKPKLCAAWLRVARHCSFIPSSLAHNVIEYLTLWSANCTYKFTFRLRFSNNAIM